VGSKDIQARKEVLEIQESKEPKAHREIPEFKAEMDSRAMLGQPEMPVFRALKVIKETTVPEDIRAILVMPEYKEPKAIRE
jgi:hypothetical protein